MMEGLLAGISGIAVLLDDILISGKDEKEHQEQVCEVLKRLESEDLKLKKSKYIFGAKVVTFWGY